MMKLPPRPVALAPTEVAIMWPRDVLLNSVLRFESSARLTIPPQLPAYHGL
jgi:hypothetical protein